MKWLEGNYICSRILIIALLLLLNWYAMGVIPLNMGTDRKGCKLSAYINHHNHHHHQMKR